MKRSLEDFLPLPQGADQFPLEFIEARGALKLVDKADAVVVGLVDPEDSILTSELGFFLKKPVEVVAVTRQELTEYLSGQITADAGAGSAEPDSERDYLDRLANDAPIVNLVNNILLEGIRKGCSDIHVEALPERVRVRYRIDGRLITGRVLARDSFPGVSSRLKVMANLNIIERRQPQDGRLSVRLGTQEVEFRVSIVPLADGESIVLRLFQKAGGPVSLERLGFGPGFLSDLRTVAQSPNGLILITGPTGSGKTTTLNALIQELSTDENKILTIEDPVENFLDGVNQIQTNEAIGLTFETILRRLLRQDPDILMVGEIRDKKTAELSLRSALTGHLVLSTLHTNDALAAIPRLFNMGVEPFLLSAVLRACAAQRLVRLVCPHCAGPKNPTPVEVKILGEWGLDTSGLRSGAGCAECGKTGFKGRTVVGEIFLMDEACEEMIVSERKRKDFFQYFEQKGSRTLFRDGLERVARGETTLAELERSVLNR